MTQAQHAQQMIPAPRAALMAALLIGALLIGIVGGLALAGSSLAGGLIGDEASGDIDAAVLLSGLDWERQREQQRMFGETIPAGWFQRVAE